MIRLVPKEEAAFKDRVRNLVWQFIQDEGLNFRLATDMISVDENICGLASRLWYVKSMVKPEDTDLMNTKEARAKWEKEIEDAKRKGTMTYSCACGLMTKDEKKFDSHDCKFRKLQRRSFKK
jgi:hypothetical protein